MTTTQPDRLDRIEAALEQLAEQSKTDIGLLSEQLKDSKRDIEQLTEQVKESNLKIDLFQKASQQVVNLAFGLLSVAALAIIVPAVFNN